MELRSAIGGARPRILITSVGSLVGQNLLDVLDHPAFLRRDRVTVIGTNSIASSPGNFRCDRCYLLPETASPAFAASLADVLRDEQPQLVLCGRDEDTLAVRALLDAGAFPEVAFPHGSLSSLRIALDKRETARFCRRHGLPFADTWIPGEASFETFAARAGYPLIAKPALGFASRGVYYIRDAAQAARFIAGDDLFQEYLFQEYLGDAALLEPYFAALEIAPPLFAHAPGVFHHSAHCFIGRDGGVAEVFVSRNTHSAGVTMGFERVEHATLHEHTLRFAEALHAEGGFGPMTVQYRPDRAGNWKAMEINLRTNGNTYPRFLLGQDDLADIFDTLLPDEGFPRPQPFADCSDILIGKSVIPRQMSKRAIARLETGSEAFNPQQCALPVAVE